MYKVIKKFKDLQDNDYIYEVGDEFPRKGNRVTIDRTAELLGSDNKIGEPLIEEIVEIEDTKEDDEIVVKPKKSKSKK